MYVEIEVVTIEQMQTLAQIGQAYAPFLPAGRRTVGVDTVETLEPHLTVTGVETYLHKRTVAIAYAVLEGVFDHAYEQQRRQHHSVVAVVGHMQAYVYVFA